MRNNIKYWVNIAMQGFLKKGQLTHQENLGILTVKSLVTRPLKSVFVSNVVLKISHLQNRFVTDSKIVECFLSASSNFFV